MPTPALLPGDDLFQRFTAVAGEMLIDACQNSEREAPEIYRGAMAAVGSGKAALAMIVQFAPMISVSVRVQGVVQDGERREIELCYLSAGDDSNAGHA